MSATNVIDLTFTTICKLPKLVQRQVAEER